MKVKDIKDTILHEIAHAIVGPGHGHDAAWRAVAINLGVHPRACKRADLVKGVTRADIKKYTGTCPSCGKHIYRDKRKQLSCGTCSPHIFNSQYVFTWKQN